MRSKPEAKGKAAIAEKINIQTHTYTIHAYTCTYSINTCTHGQTPQLTICEVVPS
jgi:hypothetical protein